MRIFKWVAVPAAVVCACGCFSSAPRMPALWTVEYRPQGGGEAGAGDKSAAGAGESLQIRISRVDVRAPFDGERLAVMRADGSIAKDPLNSFAAPPASLLRWAAVDAIGAMWKLRGNGAAAAVIDRLSSASADYSIELTVARLALDCRGGKPPKASIALSAILMDGRKIVCKASGEAQADAVSGDYTAAFSQAFAAAMESLLSGMKIPES